MIHLHPTDAALHLIMRRQITLPNTTSDHLLWMADALDEAAKSSTSDAEAKVFKTRAGELRTMAPLFAERPLVAAEAGR